MKPASNGLCTKPPQSLLEGTYDEASSAKSFQEALAEWRSGGSVAASNIYSKKSIIVGNRKRRGLLTIVYLKSIKYWY